MACLINSGGQVLREKRIFGKDRQWRSKVVSDWESCKSGCFLRWLLTFSTLFSRAALQNEEGPIGQPRREKLSSARGISGGSGLEIGDVGLGEKSSDLALLSLSPLGDPLAQ